MHPLIMLCISMAPGEEADAQALSKIAVQL